VRRQARPIEEEERSLAPVLGRDGAPQRDSSHDLCGRPALRYRWRPQLRLQECTQARGAARRGAPPFLPAPARSLGPRHLCMRACLHLVPTRRCLCRFRPTTVARLDRPLPPDGSAGQVAQPWHLQAEPTYSGHLAAKRSAEAMAGAAAAAASAAASPASGGAPAAGGGGGGR